MVISSIIWVSAAFGDGYAFIWDRRISVLIFYLAFLFFSYFLILLYMYLIRFYGGVLFFLLYSLLSYTAGLVLWIGFWVHNWSSNSTLFFYLLSTGWDLLYVFYSV